MTSFAAVALGCGNAPKMSIRQPKSKGPKDLHFHPERRENVAVSLAQKLHIKVPRRWSDASRKACSCSRLVSGPVAGANAMMSVCHLVI